jgi:hypothetical protein
MTVNEFDPRRILEVLNGHHVDYVLVGGYAAQLYGARRPTYDIDIAPSTTLENLNRLSAALRELGAGIRVDEVADSLPFNCTGESLRGRRGTVSDADGGCGRCCDTGRALARCDARDRSFAGGCPTPRLR